MDSTLTRYWFPVISGPGIGVGVTAYSLKDAETLITGEPSLASATLGAPVVNVDIRALDQGHVIPNMKPPNLRGIWFPYLSHLH